MQSPESLSRRFRRFCFKRDRKDRCLMRQKTSDQHFERGQEFRSRTEPVEIACGADLRRAGSDVAEAGDGDRHRGFPGAFRADGGDQQRKQQDDAHVGGEESDGFLDGGRLQTDIVQVNARDELREDIVFDLGQTLPPYQQRADAFEAARSRAAAAADHGNTEKQRDRNGRP